MVGSKDIVDCQMSVNGGARVPYKTAFADTSSGSLVSEMVTVAGVADSQRAEAGQFDAKCSNGAKFSGTFSSSSKVFSASIDAEKGKAKVHRDVTMISPSAAP